MNETTPREESRRLFFALWPDAACRAALAQLVQTIVPARARPLQAENLHITLIFLGRTSPAQLECARKVAGAIRAPNFTLTLDRIGQFRRARVLWSAPAATPEALQRLVAELGTDLEPCGFALDTRPYHAHVTLARNVRGRIQPTVHEPIAWRVDHFVLVESQTRSHGAHYEVLESWPLTGS